MGPGCAGGRRRRRPAERGHGRRQRRAGPHHHALHAAAGLAEPAHADGDGERAPARRLSRALCARRNHLGHRHLRARRRRRSGRHDHARRTRRRRLGHQRPQDLDQPRRRRRLHHPDGGHRQGEARARRHLRLPGRQGHARLQRAAPHPDDRRRGHLRSRAGGLPRRGLEAAGDRGQRLRADAASPRHAAHPDGRLVGRHGAARARHDVRVRAAARDLRRSRCPSARRSSGGWRTPRPASTPRG